LIRNANIFSGYQVYFTAIGPKTPCYSAPTTVYVPATTPTTAGFTLITDHVFSHMYTLAPPEPSRPPLPLGGLIGIVVNVVLFVAIIAVLVFYLRRRKAKRAAAAAAMSTTFPPEEPVLPAMTEVGTPVQSPQELASPEPHQTQSPSSRWRNWPLGFSSPPAYERPAYRNDNKNDMAAQELPGSTFIHEHHPAFEAGDRMPISPTTPPKTPSTPTRSPIHSDTRSFVSPGSPGAKTLSPPVISPLGSPRMPGHSS